MNHGNRELRKRQAEIEVRYRRDPDEALIVDHGRTTTASPGEPFHTTAVPGEDYGISIPIGVHRGVGGPHDQPNLGEMLCTTLAACLDTSIRMVAHLMGIELDELDVHVTGRVDLRGTLAMSDDVDVRFEDMHCDVHVKLATGTDPPVCIGCWMPLSGPASSVTHSYVRSASRQLFRVES